MSPLYGFITTTLPLTRVVRLHRGRDFALRHELQALVERERDGGAGPASVASLRNRCRGAARRSAAASGRECRAVPRPAPFRFRRCPSLRNPPSRARARPACRSDSGAGFRCSKPIHSSCRLRRWLSYSSGVILRLIHKKAAVAVVRLLDACRRARRGPGAARPARRSAATCRSTFWD